MVFFLFVLFQVNEGMRVSAFGRNAPPGERTKESVRGFFDEFVGARLLAVSVKKFSPEKSNTDDTIENGL